MSIRARLALWYGALLGLVLAVALSAAYFAHRDAHLADVDAELGRLADAAASGVQAAQSASTPLAATALPDPGHDHGLFLLDAASGRAVASAGDQATPAADQLPRGGAAGTAVVGGSRARILVRDVGGARIVATAALGTLDASLAGLRTLLAALGIGGIAVALAGGWAIAASALRPVALLTATARTIAGAPAPSRRLPDIDRRDELGELARTLNGMLARLETAAQVERRFVGDASHELRTPLTTVRGNAELLLQDDADPDERREAAGQILRETARLGRLVDQLLAIARADAETGPLARSPVELDEVVLEAVGELRAGAGDRLRVRALDRAAVAGDRDGLKQLTLILLDNALRYSPHGRVEVSVGSEGRSAFLRVDDEGIGVDAEAAARAFDRFYRGAAARRLAPEGTGLGLSIARRVVERHGGTIELRRRTPAGTSAVVRLPATLERSTSTAP